MWNIIGHEQILRYLETTAQHDRTPPALLFIGESGSGKMTTAKQFAEYLLCEDALSNRPCRACRSCQSIHKGIHPDVWVSSESDEEHTSIDVIRPLITRLSGTAFGTTKKIAILDHTERLTPEAANALLKTLEEPTKGSIIILLTTNEHILPKTLRSRMAPIRFLPVSEATLEAALKKEGVSRDDAHRYAVAAEGKPGRAIMFAHDPETWENYEEEIERFFSFVSKNLFERFAEAGGKESETIAKRLPLWTSLLRTLLIRSLNPSWESVYVEWNSDLDRMIRNHSPEYFASTLRNLLLLKKHIQQNVQERIALESFALHL